MSLTGVLQNLEISVLDPIIVLLWFFKWVSLIVLCGLFFLPVSWLHTRLLPPPWDAQSSLPVALPPLCTTPPLWPNWEREKEIEKTRMRTDIEGWVLLFKSQYLFVQPMPSGIYHQEVKQLANLQISNNTNKQLIRPKTRESTSNVLKFHITGLF